MVSDAGGPDRYSGAVATALSMCLNDSMHGNGAERAETSLQALGFYTAPPPPQVYAWFLWLNIITPALLQLTDMILRWIDFPYWVLWSGTTLTTVIALNLLNLWFFASVRSWWSCLFLVVAILNVVWSLLLGGTSFLLNIYNIRFAATVFAMLKQNGMF